MHEYACMHFLRQSHRERLLHQKNLTRCITVHALGTMVLHPGSYTWEKFLLEPHDGMHPAQCKHVRYMLCTICTRREKFLMEIRGLERAKDDMVVEQVGEVAYVNMCVGGSGPDQQEEVVVEKGEGGGAGSAVSAFTFA